MHRIFIASVRHFRVPFQHLASWGRPVGQVGRAHRSAAGSLYHQQHCPAVTFCYLAGAVAEM